MANRNSTVEIKDGKVVFSQEIINYFENLRNEENSEWIDKYFEYLSCEENLNATKYETHHIIPAFLFSDENHKNRKETEPLADMIYGNKIKLSYENHVMVHYFLWKIFPNDENARRPVYLMLGKIDIRNVTENQAKEFAKIQEECKKENWTKEDKKRYMEKWEKEHEEERKLYWEGRKEITKERAKEWARKNKDKKNKSNKKWKNSNKEKVKAYNDNYKETHKEECKKSGKKYREEHKERIREYNLQYKKEHSDEIADYNNQLCFDPINNDNCRLATLYTRKSKHKEKYQNINPKNCIIE